MAHFTSLLPQSVLTGQPVPQFATFEGGHARARQAAPASTSPSPSPPPFTAASPAEGAPTTRPPLRETLSIAGKRALGGGIPGKREGVREKERGTSTRTISSHFSSSVHHSLPLLLF